MSAPRIRSLKPEMWQDEKVGALSHEARLLATVLVTMADDEGRLRAGPGLIIGHGYPYDQDASPPRVTPAKLAGWLAEIAAAGMVVTYEAGGLPYAAFRHWRRHQRIQRPRKSVLPAPPDPVVVRDNAIPTQDASGTHHGTITDDAATETRSITDGEVLPRVPDPDPDPVVDLIDAHATGIEAETIAVLQQLPRLFVNQVGVENAICAYPNADPILGARQVVAWASDPAFTATDAARLLMSALSKQKPVEVDEKAARTARRKEALKRVQEANAA